MVKIKRITTLILLAVFVAFTMVACSGTENGGTHTHNYSQSVIKPPTCTESGKSKYTCYCGATYTQDTILEEESASEVFDDVKESVGEIVTYDKSGRELALGTCFVYSEDGKFLTNYHVIEDSYSARITINGKTYSVAKVLGYDKDIDLAMLKVNATNLKAVKICTKEHAVGKKVFAIGSSKGLTATFSQGIITCANRTSSGVNYVQHDAAISSGNSGGPLVNGYAEVIGINTLTIRDSQNLNFAIMTSEINKLNLTNPLTYYQFYEKESDVVAKLKNYIISYGEYDYADNEYTVDFAESYWNDTHSYRTGAIYDVENDRIQLTCFVYKYDLSYAMMTFLYIDSVASSYEWLLMDMDYSYMTGYIYPSTFSASTTLAYTTQSGFTYSAYTVRERASEMIYQTLADIDVDFASIGIDASDFGFIYIY